MMGLVNKRLKIYLESVFWVPKVFFNRFSSLNTYQKGSKDTLVVFFVNS